MLSVYIYNDQLCMVFIQTELWFLRRRYFKSFPLEAVHFFFNQWWSSLISDQHKKINKIEIENHTRNITLGFTFKYGIWLG